MLKYHVANSTDFQKALGGSYSPFAGTLRETPSLGDLDLLPGERVAAIQNADAVFIVAPLGRSIYGCEIKIDAVAMAKFVRYHGLRPEQVCIVDRDSVFEFDWRVPQPSPAAWEEATGVRLTAGQVAKMHAAAIAPDLDLVKGVRIARVHLNRTPDSPEFIALPDLSGRDLGVGAGDPEVDALIVNSSDSLQQVAIKSLLDWTAQTSRFAPGEAEKLYADHAARLDLATCRSADGPEKQFTGGPMADPQQAEKARLQLVEGAKADFAKRHFVARIVDRLDGDAVRSARCVVVTSRNAGLPSEAWEAFSAGRPVVVIGPELVLPFDGKGINYDGIVLQLAQRDLPKLGSLVKLWLNQRTPEQWADAGRRALGARGAAKTWPQLLVNTISY